MSRNRPNRTALFVSLGLLGLALSACGGAEARKAKHLQKGKTYLAAGNFEKARVEFQNALQISPIDPEARFENGLADEKLGKTREAAQFFQGTIDVSPDHVGARTALARLYLFSGATDKALDLIKPALDKHPDDSELLTLRAAARVQKGDIADAQRDAERAVELNPLNEDAVSALAGIYVSSKAPDKAQSLLEQAIKKIPGSVDLRFTLAQVYASVHRPADTERLLIEIVKLQPAEKAHRIRLAQFYLRQSQLDQAEHVLRDGIKALPQDRDLKLALIDFLSANRSVDAAEKELRGMIAADPGDSEMKFALAKFYAANRHPEQAEKIYREVIDHDGLNSTGIIARDRLAALLAQRNEIKAAEDLIAQVLGKSPRDTEALVLRGDIALSRQDAKSAIADLRTVLRDQPNAIGVLRTLARAHLMNGEPAIAEETMRRALEANPKDPSLRLDLAELLTQIGKADQAKPILAGLVKDQPNDVAAWEALFRVSASLKDYDTAGSAADTLVALQPKRAIGYFFQGLLAEEAKRTGDALRLYGQATDLEADAIEPLKAQVRLLVMTNRSAEAVKRLDEVAAKTPTSPVAPEFKGELYRAQNNFEGAEAAYRTAIARSPRSWVPYQGLAAAQFAGKKPEEAIATLRAAEPNVDDPEKIDFEIASYVERAGKPDEAIREYESVVRRDPSSDAAANNLAMLLVTYGKDSASLDRAKTLAARFADSSNPTYLDTYGWVLFKHGEAAASVPVLERVVSKVPHAAEALYHLGMAQSQSGSTTQAVDNLTRAVNSGAKFSGLDEAKATLNKLAKLSPDAAPKT